MDDKTQSTVKVYNLPKFVADEADKSFQEGLEGATQSSRLSALASMKTQNATPSTIVSLQLPIAGTSESIHKICPLPSPIKMLFHKVCMIGAEEVQKFPESLEES